MKRKIGKLYFRKIEIVDDMEQTIYKAKDIGVKIGMDKILNIIEAKDSRKTVNNILYRFSRNLDNKLKEVFNLED